MDNINAIGDQDLRLGRHFIIVCPWIAGSKTLALPDLNELMVRCLNDDI
jgi:hypothetical protein